MSRETVITQRTLLALGSRPDCKVWRQNSGVGWQPLTPQARAAFDALRAAHPGGFRPVKYGVPGCADISGILRDGRRLEVENKTDTGRLSPEQVAFGAMIEAHGGVYIVARHEDEAVAGVEAAASGATIVQRNT